MSLLIKIFRKEDDRAVWALLFCIIFLSIFFSFCFHRAVWALESCHLLPIIFTEDTLIELADPAAEIYIAAASEVSEIVVEADTLVANCIWSDKHLNLKSDSHRILQMSPSGGSADLIFSSQYLDDGYVTSWIAVHNVSTEFIFGVPDMQRYSVFVDDEEITGSPFSPSNGQVSFSRTGSGQAETYVVTNVDFSSNMFGWAWSENIGWISFNSANCDSDGDGLTDTGNYDQCSVGEPIAEYGALINPVDYKLSGYIWSEYVGWITFDRGVAGAPPSGDVCPDESCLARVDQESLALQGWARAVAHSESWDGWVKLAGEVSGQGSYGLALNSGTGRFERISDVFPAVWGSDVIGWISFNSEDRIAPLEYYVYTTLIESDMLVITKEAEVQASYRATLNGSVELAEGSVYPAQGFEWGTQSGGPYDYSWRKTGIFSAGDFSYSAENLETATLYYYRARALEGSSWIYGAEKSFTTTSPGSKSYGQAEIIIRHGSKERGIKITPEGGISGR